MQNKRLYVTLAVLIVVATAVFVAWRMFNRAVGSAGSPTSSPDPDEALLAFAQCMRENGIPNFPDPAEDGISLGGTSIDRNSPEFKAAEKACKTLLPQQPSSNTGGNSAWQKVLPGGDSECADGSEFAFWVHETNPTKVVFYLDGGGVCFDVTSCANTNTVSTTERAGPDYDPNIEGENPGGEGGMFDFSRDDNPFRDYSFIYVPLCTADSHLGDVSREYSQELTVEHNGFVNGTAALKYLAEHYPDAAQVVVLGKTAGSVAAPIYGGLVADLLPDAQITVFGAQSGAFPDVPDLNAEIIGELWGAYDTMPDWEVNEGLTARDWGTRRFWIQAGLHDPDIVMARFDYAFDPHAVEALEYLSISGIDPSNPLAVIDANEAAIEAAGVVLHSYTAPGQGHGILEYETFYDIEVNGVRLVDWVEVLIAGKPLDDVHCDECVTQ